MKRKWFIFLLLLISKLGLAQNAHFWNGIEAFDGPTDENPVLASQIDFYFDKLVAPLPDSITLEINRLIERTSFNTDLRDFILWHLLEKYHHPEYMNQDQVFVWLYDEYFSQMDLKDDLNLFFIREHAEKVRRLALFAPAPHFILNGLERSINLCNLDSEYTILFFFDHDCDLCQEERWVLDSICSKNAQITVLAIDINDDWDYYSSHKQSESPSERWLILNGNDYIGENPINSYYVEATPLIYVLDKDKHIIAKKIRAKQIPLIL